MEETSKRVLLGPFPSTLESAPLPSGPLGDAMRESLSRAADDAGIAANPDTGEILPDPEQQLGIATVARGQTDLPEGY